MAFTPGNVVASSGDITVGPDYMGFGGVVVNPDSVVVSSGDVEVGLAGVLEGLSGVIVGSGASVMTSGWCLPVLVVWLWPWLCVCRLWWCDYGSWWCGCGHGSAVVGSFVVTMNFGGVVVAKVKRLWVLLL